MPKAVPGPTQDYLFQFIALIKKESKKERREGKDNGTRLGGFRVRHDCTARTIKQTSTPSLDGYLFCLLYFFIHISGRGRSVGVPTTYPTL